MSNTRIFYTEEPLQLKRRGEGVWMPEKGKTVLGSLNLDLVDEFSLGEGQYSQVRRVYSRKLNQNFAFKKISKLRAPREVVEKYLPREITIMQQLGHERLVEMEAVLVTDHHTFILMENVANGDMTQYINRRGHLCEEEARMLFHQLLDAVSYLHALDVVHRDIKCDNIYMDENYNIKLGDFGFAAMCEDGQKMNEFCGSYAYTAPEILAGEAYDGKKADVWSMGVVLYAILCGRLPFHDETFDILIDDIFNPQRKLLFHKKVSKDCRAFVRSMLTIDPKARASVSKLKRMDWMNKPIDMSTADYKTPQSSFESIAGGDRPRRTSIDMHAEHGFFESQSIMEKNEKQRPHTVTDVLRAVAVRHAYSDSTTDIHKHVGLRPGTHLKATDVGLSGPAGRRISVQLSQQNLPIFITGMMQPAAETQPSRSARGARRASVVPDRKDSLSLLTSAARKGAGIRRGSLGQYGGALCATGSHIMMSNEDLMASAISLNQSKINKELHDMHYHTGAKVALAAGFKRHKSAETTRRNSVFTETLQLRSIPNSLDPEEQAIVNNFRSKCERMKDLVA